MTHENLMQWLPEKKCNCQYEKDNGHAPTCPIYEEEPLQCPAMWAIPTEPEKVNIDAKSYLMGVKAGKLEAINIIKNGGTPDTILEIQHNGETFINKKQLLEVLRK